MQTNPSSSRAGGLPAALLLALALAPGTLRAGDDELTLRINDTTAAPGGVAAVVLRTYASRGVGQGQIVVKSRRPARRGLAPSDPFVDLEGVLIFSGGDAQFVDDFDPVSQTASAGFESLSASINLVDGPLAVFYFRLAPDLQPGEEFELTLEAGTFLDDGLGLPIPVAPRAGTLTIRATGAPYQLSAEGDAVLPGEVAALAVETGELFPINSGDVVFTYDPAYASGPPVVTMDPRYGASSFTFDLSTPGRVAVYFVSLTSSLNTIIPGQVISIDLPTSTSPPSGSTTLSLDPSTQLRDALGVPIPLTLAPDVLVLDGAIFADGFESGDTSRW